MTSTIGPIEIPFKGQRDYLRFADIFPALIDAVHSGFGTDAQVDLLTIRRPFKAKIGVSFEPVESANGDFRVRNGSDCKCGWLIETCEPVSSRVPFESSPLLGSATTSADAAEVREAIPGLTGFDILAGLMKILGRQVNKRHWWLCQMNFVEPLRTAFPLCVQIRHVIAQQFIAFDIRECGQAKGTARCIVEGAKL